MVFIKSFLLFFGFVFLAGCAMTPEEIAEYEAEKKKALNYAECDGEKECKQMWDRAVYFVSKNAQRGIKLSTDNIIETYASVGGSTNLHARANKVNISGEKYRFESIWGCDNFLGCSRSPTIVMAEFNDYVRGN